RLTHNKSLNFNDARLAPGQSPSFILFKIQDTGIGINPEELEYIFEPFRQGDEKDTNANRGIGLGLSISKSIIEILGGRLKIKSQPGKGTKIYFSIPANQTIAKQIISD
ncbi:MAG TPA: ATP-binding protein, partial [Prolixibacteraceae bacterium]|nr:ATP-binding protein [Prolixibacteraceae bacterium]